MGGFRRDSRNMVWVAVVAVFLVATPMLAQIPVGTIQGVVKDSSGSVVPQAKITVTNIETNETRTAMSGDDGVYVVPAVPTGQYTVTVEKEGFKTQTQTGFTLDVAQQLAVNSALEVGSSTQQVTVTGEAPLVNTTSSTLGGLVSEEKMADLPLNGRNYIDLTVLQPGITKNTNMGTNGGVAGTFYSSNGAPILGNNVNIDGAYMITTQGGSSASISGTTLGVDGIKEYKVITTAFGAEYGMSFGSQTTIVSRGGTNHWHGDVFEYLRNSSLDARNYFDTPQTSGGKRLPEFRRNNFGASGGGPIQKDKTFFYVVYEGLRQHLGFTALDNVVPVGCYAATNNPCAVTAANPSGNVNMAIRPILALYSNEVNANGGAGIISPGTISASAPKAAQYGLSTAAVNQADFGQIRVDHNFSASDSLFGRWTIDNDIQNVPTTQAAGANGSSGVAFPDFYVAERSRNQFLTVAESHIFSPTLLNSLHASFSRVNSRLLNTASAAVGGETGNSQVSLVSGYAIGAWTLSQTPALSGWGDGGTNGPPAVNPLQNVYTGSEDLFWERNKHSFKFGVLYNRFNESLQAANNTSGAITFQTISSFLNGIPFSVVGNTPGTELNRDFIFNTWGFYGQDDWRVTSRLTLNLGLRWEFFTTPYELLGRQNSWDVANYINGSLVAYQTPVYGPIIKNRSYKNVSPRLGFAYDVFGKGKTAVRGAFGIYGEVGNLGGTIRLDMLSDPPYSGRLTLSNPPPYCNNPGCNLLISFPALPAGAQPNSLQAYQSGFYGNTLNVADYQGYGEPHVAQWNLTVEQQLPLGLALSVSYVGTRGLQLFQEDEGNPVAPTSTTATDPTTGQQNVFYWNPAMLSCENPTNPQAVNGSGVYTSLACGRLNPYWDSTILDSTHGNSWYNGLQVQVIKRLSHGLQLQGEYTYSKVLDTGQGNISGVDCAAIGGDHGAMPLNETLDKGHACFDATHVANFNLLYHFPNIASNAWYSKLTNGWWTGNIVSINSGFYFTPVLSTNRSANGVGGTAGGPDRPDRNTAAEIAAAGCPSSPTCNYAAVPYNPATVITGNPTQWFNPYMFNQGTPGYFGNAGRDSLRGPGSGTWNFSLVKDTRLPFLGEAGNLEFRAEVFNVLNRANFSTPASTTIFGGSFNLATGAGVPAFAPTASPSATAGQILTTANPSRQIQLALKILF